ncbi:MAG: DUF4325 domain-containing protein [Candidatus Omnitrophica bacterium]|nr:DUF4325 domain-containing protein [Candidatus Omnitrophota bacterium]
MDVQKLILRLLDKNGQVKSAQIVKATGFSRAYINSFFQELRDEGKIVLIGKANKAHYILAGKKAVAQSKKNIKKVHLILNNKGIFEHEVLDNIKKASSIFDDIPLNITSILEYAFTEMLNNAIEHSRSEKVEITMEKLSENIAFTVFDKGVGIFNNIMRKRKLDSTLEAVQELLKGKQSTMPETHSGEGIFFTSKAADMLTIKSSTKKLMFDGFLSDIFLKDTKETAGTKVYFCIEIDSKKQLSDLFREYTDDSFEFSKTKVKVKLFKDKVNYVSRSQARRILSGIDKFKTLILDFKDIDTIGQGFADEIFRVWHSKHPQKRIEVLNAGENTRFMIERAKKLGG